MWPPRRWLPPVLSFENCRKVKIWIRRLVPQSIPPRASPAIGIEGSMTIAELNDLIARGAAQPGVRDVEELMRLT